MRLAAAIGRLSEREAHALRHACLDRKFAGTETPVTAEMLRLVRRRLDHFEMRRAWPDLRRMRREIEARERSK